MAAGPSGHTERMRSFKNQREAHGAQVQTVGRCQPPPPELTLITGVGSVSQDLKGF